MKKLLYSLALVLPLTLLAQDVHKFSHTLPLSGTKESNIRLEIPAGELTLKTGTSQLIDTKVNYNLKDWKPSTNITRNNGSTSLTIKQKSNNGNNDAGENKWNVSLNKSTPLNLSLTMGAGESDLDLSNSRLQKLEVEAGAVSCDINLKGSTVKVVEIAAGVGELNLDMTGNWDHNVQVDISGGIGEVNLKLPKNVGVRLNPTGLGSKNLNGFKKKGSYYQNAAYGKSKHTLTINVSGGMGSINVVEG
ncbi:toast rack family protein [Pontibacter populi]|uniref:Toast rack family protein n=1 Tax=Pontibacter populi TaxID=890055 RepID=A0ABV1RTX3_9BACT